MITAKTERIRREIGDLFAEYAIFSPLLMPVALVAAAEIARQGARPVVTGLIRTRDEQKALCASLGIRFYETVHSYGRGLDLRSRGLSARGKLEVERRVNGAFQYKTASGRSLLVCSLHLRGTAEHFHIQVPHGNKWGAVTI